MLFVVNPLRHRCRAFNEAAAEIAADATRAQLQFRRSADLPFNEAAAEIAADAPS